MAPKRKTGPAPKTKTGPIPTGWTLKTAVQKDGSETSFYYCPVTRQHFYTYFELMRYVEYAKRAGLSIYAPCCKSVKRIKSLEKQCGKKKTISEKDSNVSKSRKTSAILSLSKSISLKQSMDSQSSTSGESSSREKGQDYVPESESNARS